MFRDLPLDGPPDFRPDFNAVFRDSVRELAGEKTATVFTNTIGAS
jgi:hypothetical protein